MQYPSLQNVIHENIVLIFILLLGAVLRIYNLGGESVWHDEAVTSRVARLNLVEFIKWIIDVNDNNPPLYYMLMHFWVSLFGDSEFSLRLPSAILGTGSILMIYAVGNQIFNRTAGLIASLILALSVFNIEYSQEARAYSLMAFLTLLSFYFFLKTLSAPKTHYVTAYIAASVLLLYSHFYAVFILAAQNIFCLTRYFLKRDVFNIGILKWIGLQAIIGFLFIPGLLLWYKNTFAIQRGFWLPEPTFSDLAIYSYHFAGRDYILCFVWVALAALSFIGFKNEDNSEYCSNIKYIKHSQTIISNAYAMYLLLLWLFVPILIPFIVSHLSTPILHTRYIISSSLALYLLVAKGVWNLHSKRLKVLVPLVILLLSIWPLRMYYVVPHKHQWREAVAFLESNARENDNIFVYPYYDTQAASYYRNREDLRFLPLGPEPDGHLPERFWVVFGQFSKADEEEVKGGILGGYDLKPVKSFNKLNLYIHEKDF